jgi:hypothetical protein
VSAGGLYSIMPALYMRKRPWNVMPSLGRDCILKLEFIFGDWFNIVFGWACSVCFYFGRIESRCSERCLLQRAISHHIGYESSMVSCYKKYSLFSPIFTA